MKRKIFFLLLLATTAISVSAQDIFFTRTGKIEFHSGSSLEDIDGVNNEATSMLNIKTGEMAFTLLVKSFTFKRALMEEHFNENYMESTKFPKASFKGKITGMPAINIASNGSYNVQTEGELTIHGVSQKISAPAKLTVNGGKITGVSSFKIDLSDYKIVIPGVVAEKFSKETEIVVTCIYEPRS
jgi:polyisoprenoid-binding protein YceI